MATLPLSPPSSGKKLAHAVPTNLYGSYYSIIHLIWARRTHQELRRLPPCGIRRGPPVEPSSSYGRCWAVAFALVRKNTKGGETSQAVRDTLPFTLTQDPEIEFKQVIVFADGVPSSFNTTIAEALLQLVALPS